MKAISLKDFCAQESITSIKDEWKRGRFDSLYIVLLHCEDDPNPIYLNTSQRYTNKCVVGERADVKSLIVYKSDESLSYYCAVPEVAKSVKDLFGED